MPSLTRKTATLEKLKQLKTLRRDQLVSEHDVALERKRHAEDAFEKKERSYEKALSCFQAVTAAGEFIDVFQLDMASQSLSYCQHDLERAEQRLSQSNDELHSASEKLQIGQGELNKVTRLEDKLVQQQLWTAERRQSVEADNVALTKWWLSDRN
tara:strand:- start:289 stop:753 length:465 start_codon:yes stop_codon:yes gene_type:complete